MHNIIYEIQYRHHVRRRHCSYPRKNREKSIFYVTHYMLLTDTS